MGDYTRQNDFSAKDALATGNPLKVIKGRDVDDELDAARTAINSKIDTPSATVDQFLVYDGTDFEARTVQMPANIGELAPANDLTVIINDFLSTAIDIDADELLMVNPSTGEWRIAPDVDLSMNILVSGVGGLDTADTEQASTWYHCWAIWDGVLPAVPSVNIFGMLSSSGNAPTLGVYTHQAYCGAVYNDSGSSFNKFAQSGSLALGEREDVISDQADTTYTSIDLSAFIPPTAQSVLLDVGVSNTTADASCKAYVSATDDGVGRMEFRNGTDNFATTQMEIPLVTPSTVWYKVDDTDERITIRCSGWRF